VFAVLGWHKQLYPTSKVLTAIPITLCSTQYYATSIYEDDILSKTAAAIMLQTFSIREKSGEFGGYSSFGMYVMKRCFKPGDWGL